jgi:uncharacterized membrane protein (DUF2068 family)
MLWLIGGFKLAKGLLLVAVGVSALYFANHDIARSLERWVAWLHLHPSNHYVDGAVGRLVAVEPHTLRAIGVGTFVYAAIFLTEGTGLLLRRRWAEYLTVIVTASFLPLELYELVRRVSVTRMIFVAVNLAIVVYLIAVLRRPR